ncbi:MAG: hypothetical protein AAGI38_25240, partial [Bacteroidota bacterium]
HMLENSEDRMVQFWGEQRGKSVLVYCDDEESFKKYGSGTPGVAYLNPLSSFIILGRDGLNEDVISHELCHVELYDRLGWIKSHLEKPTWFDEGLALMVDYRYASEESRYRHFGFLVDWDRKLSVGISPLPLHSLETLEDFSHGNREKKLLAYLSSGLEVSRWLDVVGPNGMSDLVESIREGNSFEKAYRQLEQESITHALRKELP